MLKTGILSRYCAIYNLLAQAGAVADFDAKSALALALRVVESQGARQPLQDVQRAYDIFMTQIPALAEVDQLPEGMADELFKRMQSEIQTVISLESANENFDVIEYYTSNALAAANEVLQDVEAIEGGGGEFFYGGPEGASEGEAELAPEEVTSSIFESAQQLPGSHKQKVELDPSLVAALEEKKQRQLEREKELRKINPLLPATTGGLAGIGKMTDEEKEVFEKKLQKRREAVWDMATKYAKAMAKKMDLTDEEAGKFAYDYYEKAMMNGPATIEEYFLWDEAMRYGIGLARGRGELEKGTNPWHSVVAKRYARQYYVAHGGRIVGYRQRQTSQRAVRRHMQFMQQPELLEQRKQMLDALPKTPEQAAERKRRHRARQKAKQEEAAKQIYPPGYKPPRYADDIPY